MEQEEWLTAVVTRAGFNILLHPKYNCTSNHIAMVWGWTKSYHRRTCTYVKRDLPTALLQTLAVECSKRFFRNCLRFMSFLREGFEGPLLDFAIKKYRSRCYVPTGLRTFSKADYKEYKDKKRSKR